MLQIIIPIIFIILGIAGVCADIAIIYTIFRFKRLRSAFNIFLANWAISDLLSIIVLPINYGIAAATQGPSMEVKCILMEGALVLHLTEILFGIVLCLDWCFAAYFQKVSEKFRKYYRYVITSVWILSLLFYCISTSLCVAYINNSIITWLFGIFYSLSLIFVIVLQCSKLGQRCRRLPISYPKPLQLRLTLITIIIFAYLLPAISMLLLLMEIFYHIIAYFIVSVILAACSVLSSSVVTLILLCCLNYEFRQCLFQLRKPAHERFDNDCSETEDTVKPPPEILFHTSTQDILTNGHQDLIS